jgi:hypothetical protein
VQIPGRCRTSCINWIERRKHLNACLWPWRSMQSKSLSAMGGEVEALHRGLPAGGSIRNKAVEGSGQRYPVGPYGYVRLTGRVPWSLALILESKRLEKGRQSCLLAWLYTQAGVPNLLPSLPPAQAWPSDQALMVSTHLQMVDCDTLDCLLEQDLIPNAGVALDLVPGISSFCSHEH